MSNLGQGYWERRRVGGTHTRDTGKKGRKKCCSLPTVSFSPDFALIVAAKYISWTKFKWGQSVAWLIFGIIFPT